MFPTLVLLINYQWILRESLISKVVKRLIRRLRGENIFYHTDWRTIHLETISPRLYSVPQSSDPKLRVEVTIVSER